jgi:hypothetical protein
MPRVEIMVGSIDGSRSAVTGLDQAALVGEHDCLHPVAEMQFGQDAGDVGFDRRFTEEQYAADLCV